MTTDTAHTLIAFASLAMIGIGAYAAWGIGYAALTIGGLLLAGVIYARVRQS